MSLMDHSTFICPEFIIRAASETWELQGVSRLRHQVFVEEQRIFVGSDHDEIDARAIPLRQSPRWRPSLRTSWALSGSMSQSPASGGDRGSRSPLHTVELVGWVRS